MLKLAASRRQEADGNLVMALQGAGGMLDADAVANGYWQQQFLMQWSSRFGGGTERSEHNMIGSACSASPASRGPIKPSPSASCPVPESGGHGRPGNHCSGS